MASIFIRCAGGKAAATTPAAAHWALLLLSRRHGGSGSATTEAPLQLSKQLPIFARAMVLLITWQWCSWLLIVHCACAAFVPLMYRLKESGDTSSLLAIFHVPLLQVRDREDGSCELDVEGSAAGQAFARMSSLQARGALFSS